MSNQANNKLKRLTIISLLLAFTMTLKLALNQIAGVELITFVFIIVGLYLTTSEIGLYTISFWLLVNITEGFRLIYVPYIVIFGATALISKYLWKIDKSKYVWFGVAVALPVLTTIAYFVWDGIVYDYSYALMNLVTATPILFISMTVNLIALITLTPTFKNVLDASIYKVGVSDQKWFIKRNYIVAPITSVAIISSAFITYPTIKSFVFNSVNNEGNNEQVIIDDKFVPINSRAFNEEEYKTRINSLQDNELMIIMQFNENDQLNGNIQRFEYKFDTNNISKDRASMTDVFQYINQNDDTFRVNLVAMNIGTSLRNFWWNNVQYGQNNYCGFIYKDNKNIGAGIDYISMTSKSIIVFDYHLKSNNGYGDFCRF